MLQLYEGNMKEQICIYGGEAPEYKYHDLYFRNIMYNITMYEDQLPLIMYIIFRLEQRSL